jgi:5-methylcytosine-specific restriction endonuclease McrA
MPTVKPKTIGQSLYWAYANYAMACASVRHEKPGFQQIDFIVRNKTYYGLLRGTLQLGSFLKDEGYKMATSDHCCYCGDTNNLSIEHLIPRKRGGKHDPENLVMACRSCNSSKGSMDYLEWLAKNEGSIRWGLLRRYLITPA